MKKLETTEEMTKKVAETISSVLKSLETKEDIRKTMPLLGEVVEKIRAVSEIYETPENIFVSYLVWAQISSFTNFDGLPDEWYKLNADAIDKLRELMKAFFENIKDGFEKKNTDFIVEYIKEWLPNMLKLYDVATRTKS